MLTVLCIPLGSKSINKYRGWETPEFRSTHGSGKEIYSNMDSLIAWCVTLCTVFCIHFLPLFLSLFLLSFLPSSFPPSLSLPFLSPVPLSPFLSMPIDLDYRVEDL